MSKEEMWLPDQSDHESDLRDKLLESAKTIDHAIDEYVSTYSAPDCQVLCKRMQQKLPRELRDNMLEVIREYIMIYVRHTLTENSNLCSICWKSVSEISTPASTTIEKETYHGKPDRSQRLTASVGVGCMRSNSTAPFTSSTATFLTLSRSENLQRHSISTRSSPSPILRCMRSTSPTSGASAGTWIALSIILNSKFQSSMVILDSVTSIEYPP